MTVRSLAPFIAAAIAEIGGAYLVWIGLCEGKGAWLRCPWRPGVGRLKRARHVPDQQPLRSRAGRLRRCFIVGSPLWEVAFDGFRPDRYDVLGAGICLVGAA